MKRFCIAVLAVVISLSLSLPAFSADDAASVLSKSAAAKFWQVTADDVKAMIDSKKNDFLVVDTRPDPGMFKAGHIPGAIFIPVQDILKPENIKKLPKDKKIILVCITGAIQNLPVLTLRSMGYNVMTMKFGMAAWDKNSMGYKALQEALKGAETKNYPLEK